MAFSPGCPSFNTPSYPLKSSKNYCRESLSQKRRLCLRACAPSSS
ncbi:hypothetical protein NC652_002716 [Populus alba x Populus x berolinensis]|nr:hypothetical protein NC652_002716 [Populus alba x Populus x berolinensis]